MYLVCSYLKIWYIDLTIILISKLYQHTRLNRSYFKGSLYCCGRKQKNQSITAVLLQEGNITRHKTYVRRNGYEEDIGNIIKEKRPLDDAFPSAIGRVTSSKQVLKRT
jgi:hypothetical protein